jgi:hypothetical protein
MSETESQLKQPDPLADARAWLAAMERTLARLAAEHERKQENDAREMATSTSLRRQSAA